MAWCQLCGRDGGRRSRPLCRHTRQRTTKVSRKICWCSHVAFPHRRESDCGKHGCCKDHPLHSEKMYALLSEPVRRPR